MDSSFDDATVLTMGEEFHHSTASSRDMSAGRFNETWRARPCGPSHLTERERHSH